MAFRQAGSSFPFLLNYSLPIHGLQSVKPLAAASKLSATLSHPLLPPSLRVLLSLPSQRPLAQSPSSRRSCSTPSSSLILGQSDLTKEFPNFGRHGPLWEHSDSLHTLVTHNAKRNSERRELEEFTELAKKGMEGGESEGNRTSEKRKKACRKTCIGCKKKMRED